MRKILYIFGELIDDDIDWILAKGTREEIAAGTTLIREGQPIDRLYLVLDGTLTVSVSALKDHPIAILGCGDVPGEMSFLDSRPPSATVIAIEDSLVLSVPRSQLAEKLRQDTGFASRFYRAVAMFLSHRLRGTVAQLGYGKNIEELAEVEEEESDLTGNAALAGARFDWLIRRLKNGF